MTKEIKKTQTVFELIKKTDGNGIEFWTARDLAKVLEYSDYRNFKSVISKAKIACKNSGHRPDDHIVDITDMVEIGSGAKRKTENVKLSRYACYLIVQNADPTKDVVAQGQTYFEPHKQNKKLKKKT